MSKSILECQRDLELQVDGLTGSLGQMEAEVRSLTTMMKVIDLQLKQATSIIATQNDTIDKLYTIVGKEVETPKEVKVMPKEVATEVIHAKSIEGTTAKFKVIPKLPKEEIVYSKKLIENMAKEEDLNPTYKLDKKNPRYGKTNSPSHRAKISAALLGGDRKKFTNKEYTSSFKGVTYFKRRGVWASYIYVNSKRIHLGYYETEQEAAEEYDMSALELRGVDCITNFDKDHYTAC